MICVAPAPIVGSLFSPSILNRANLEDTRLVSPGYISPSMVFSRAQVSSFSTAFDASGNLVEYGADVPRFNGAAQRLLLEGQRTNFVSDVRFEGAVAPSTNPAGMALVQSASGVSTTIVGTGTVNGLPYVDIAVAGTASNTSALILSFRANISSGNSVAHAVGWYIQSVVGTPQIRVQPNLRTNLGGTGGTGIADQATTTMSPIGAVLTTPASGVTNATMSLRFNFTNGVTYNETIRIALPQFRQAPFMDSAILPPVGSPGAATRGQDNLTAAFSTLFPRGVGTVLGAFMLPQAASGADRALFDINNGSINNRIRLRNVAGGATIVAGRTIGGVNVDATIIGSMTPGSLFRVGVTFDGSTITANFDGGPNQTVVGQPTGLTTLRIGNNSAGTAPLGGECGYFEALPYVIAPENLPAVVSSIS